jgi:dTDP-4-dehydrorhamnose reductase
VKILITGASGQVGRELDRQGQALGMEVIETDLPELNITDIDSVARFVRMHSPDAVFNTAAWTAVDDAEAQEDQALEINATGAGNIATVCADASIPLVHYSTDYVFDGSKDGAYNEADLPNPISAYGRTKLASEKAVIESCDQHLIFRTSWVFSATGNNFVKTIVRAAQQRPSLNIVSDQTGKPTSAIELARLSLAVIAKDGIDWGVYHVAQPEPVSWYEFTEAILASARAAGARLMVDEVIPIASHEYVTKAKRPQNSVLDCRYFEDTFVIQIADWHDALESVMGDLNRGGFFA